MIRQCRWCGEYEPHTCTENQPMNSFRFSIEGTMDLDLEALWPDGDGPEDPTIEDVLALIADCGGARRIITDWDLLMDTTLYVEGHRVD